VPLDQLWMQLNPDTREEVVQRFSLMIAQSLVRPDDHGEPDNE
jgi:hypothetical protein